MSNIRRLGAVALGCGGRLLRGSDPGGAWWRSNGSKSTRRGRRRSVDEGLADFPYIEVEDVYEALAFAAAAMVERQIPLVDPV